MMNRVGHNPLICINIACVRVSNRRRLRTARVALYYCYSTDGERNNMKMSLDYIQQCREGNYIANCHVTELADSLN